MTTNASDDALSSKLCEPGLGPKLYSCCLNLLSHILKEGSITNRAKHDILNEEMAKFYLWGEGFRDGKLDIILDSSRYLRVSILKNLVAIGEALIEGEHSTILEEIREKT
jgi:hypothetical protein